MSERTAPKLNKTPFLVGDALLLAVAAWLVFRAGPPLNLWHNALVAGCVALGAWLGIMPFLIEFRTALRFAEADRLASAVEQIQRLQSVGDQIASATGRWQTVQEAADQTSRSAKEIADQITTEARKFAESMEKAHDAEVRNLRLEVEKLHRAEGDWLQVVVHTLDHVFALRMAAVRAGQTGLIEQLGNFQNACRDVARRIGLTAVEAAPGTPFDEAIHQVHEGQAPADGAVIAQMLATGYTYQGQLVRPVLVTLKSANPAAPEKPSAPEEARLPL